MPRAQFVLLHLAHGVERQRVGEEDPLREFVLGKLAGERRLQLGSGAVFPAAEEDITVKAFQMPEHWPQIGSLDFG